MGVRYQTSRLINLNLIKIHLFVMLYSFTSVQFNTKLYDMPVVMDPRPILITWLIVYINCGIKIVPYNCGLNLPCHQIIDHQTRYKFDLIFAVLSGLERLIIGIWVWQARPALICLGLGHGFCTYNNWYLNFKSMPPTVLFLRVDLNFFN